MADYGINFRDTAGYVTDGANETYCSADSYPTTRGGLTFGFTAGSPQKADRNSGVDRRLAGINFSFGASITFRLDLPSTGAWDVRFALGDYATSQGSNQVVIKDNASTVFTGGTHNTNAGSFWDAADTEYTAANWPGSNSPVSLTFSTTTMIVEIYGSVPVFAHLAISQGGSGGTGGRNLPLLGVGSVLAPAWWRYQRMREMRERRIAEIGRRIARGEAA